MYSRTCSRHVPNVWIIKDWCLSNQILYSAHVTVLAQHVFMSLLPKFVVTCAYHGQAAYCRALAKKQAAENAAVRKANREATRQAKASALDSSQTLLKPHTASLTASPSVKGPATPSQTTSVRGTARIGVEGTPQSKAPTPGRKAAGNSSRYSEAAPKRRPRKLGLFATPSQLESRSRNIVDLLGAARQSRPTTDHKRVAGTSSSSGDILQAEEHSPKQQVGVKQLVATALHILAVVVRFLGILIPVC
jgi:hypothetical protein